MKKGRQKVDIVYYITWYYRHRCLAWDMEPSIAMSFECSSGIYSLL